MGNRRQLSVAAFFRASVRVVVGLPLPNAVQLSRCTAATLIMIVTVFALQLPLANERWAVNSVM